MLNLSFQWDKVGSWPSPAAVKRQIHFSIETWYKLLVSLSDLLSRTPLKHQTLPISVTNNVLYNLLIVTLLVLIIFCVLDSVNDTSAETVCALLVAES